MQASMSSVPSPSEPASTSLQQGDAEAVKGSECPICVMMREGGCEVPFHSFMDCGAAADKGERDYTECLKAFEVMRECMSKNPEFFAPMLKGAMEEPQPDTSAAPNSEAGAQEAKSQTS
mmetsp:Transcript_21792/g.37187  ORF Transcript_21792/g.37187 Transcript_21792/m.37187 type:complete len:119 (+) Transcript_21792:72-428(+)